MSQLDWREDETLTAQLRVMSRRQRNQAAYLALRRLQAPLLRIAMSADWGVAPAVVDSLIRSGEAQLDGENDGALRLAIAELCAAPLFESEIEPEFAESFQLEAINGWLAFGDALGEMSEVQAGGLIGLARELAEYLDKSMENSLTVAEHLISNGLGYFGTRNLEVESICHGGILAAPGNEVAASSEAGRRLLDVCDEYSNQLASVLIKFPKD